MWSSVKLKIAMSSVSVGNPVVLLTLKSLPSKVATQKEDLPNFVLKFMYSVRRVYRLTTNCHGMLISLVCFDAEVDTVTNAEFWVPTPPN